MADETKKVAKVRSKTEGRRPVGALARVGCEMFRFEFEVSLDHFDLAAFYKQTGLTSSEPLWSTIFYARNEATSYHVHFDGSLRGKKIDLTLAYDDKSSATPRKDGPFAETAMKWIGSFFKEPSHLALTASAFSKPLDAWRSRFNLPFKVTMTGSDAEVTIDGISLSLPKNSHRAMRGSITRTLNEWNATIIAGRIVEFGAFDISREILIHNEALKIFIEESR